ncbi:MAG: hypothetical protein FVQ79_12640 [Planctomycetes bacterium]|nr:hypothetical protein [Planctomycetota bacterium]
MEVHRNEASLSSGILAAHGTYEKNAELKEAAPSGLASNTINIPDDDAAVADIQYPISLRMTKTQQDVTGSDYTQTKISTCPITMPLSRKRFLRKNQEF